MLADMATELDAARMLTLKAADLVGRDAGTTIVRARDADAAMAKLYASEAAHRAADKAMQILASKGYRRGSVVERLFRDVRATEIYQGTSEVQRMVIAEHILRVGRGSPSIRRHFTSASPIHSPSSRSSVDPGIISDGRQA